MVAPGACSITAAQAGNATYTAAATITQTLTVATPGSLAASQAGIYRQNFMWILDANGNHQFDGTGQGQDVVVVNFIPARPGDIPVAGDWNGSGVSKIGIYRPSSGQWYLDYNGNGTFDAGDKVYNFGGIAGDIPVVGDWNGSGTSKIGVFRSGFFWVLDVNGDGAFGTGDAAFAFGGVTGDVPVVGDWTGNGVTKVGVVRPFTQGGVPAFWILDANNNHAVDAGDLIFPFGGIVGDVPVVGDWNASGVSKAGLLRQGFYWLLDYNGTAASTLGGAEVVAFAYGGITGDVPIVGRWGTLAGSANLSVSQVVNPATVAGEAAFNITVKVQNTGVGAAQNVNLAQILPAGASVTGCVASAGACAQTGGVMNATLGTLKTGANATVTVSLIAPVVAVYATLNIAATVSTSSLQAVGAVNQTSSTVTIAPPAVSFVAGVSTMLTSQAVGASGGAVSIASTGTSLDGVTISFPTGALPANTMVQVSMTRGTLAPTDGMYPGAAMTLSVPNGMSFSQPVSITVPYTGGANFVPVPFYTDSGGALRPLQVVSIDRAAATFTFHTFRGALFTWVYALLSPAHDVAASGYLPQNDGFQVVNYGSTFNREGECFGMTSFSLWFWLNEHALGNFYPKYYGLVGSDSNGAFIRGQNVIATRAFTSVTQKWTSYIPTVAAQQGLSQADRYAAISNVIANTEAPVLIYLYHSNGGRRRSLGARVLGRQYLEKNLNLRPQLSGYCADNSVQLRHAKFSAVLQQRLLRRHHLQRRRHAHAVRTIYEHPERRAK